MKRSEKFFFGWLLLYAVCSGVALLLRERTLSDWIQMIWMLGMFVAVFISPASRFIGLKSYWE